MSKPSKPTNKNHLMPQTEFGIMGSKWQQADGIRIIILSFFFSLIEQKWG
jgi:hypothetical protein